MRAINRRSRCPGMTDHHAQLAQLWLREPDDESIGRAVRELDFPRAAAAELAQAFSDIFLLNVFPYGSVFTDPSGELNGRGADVAARLFEVAGFDAPELRQVAAPDHIGLCLAAVEPVSARADAAPFLRHLRLWAPVCCLAVEREPRAHPFYKTLARRTRDALVRSIPRQSIVHAEQPFALTVPQDDAAELSAAEMTLSDVVSYLLAPARSGVFLSRSRMGEMALALGVRVSFGSRYEVARNMFAAAGETNSVDELLGALGGEIQEWTESYESWGRELPDWLDAADHWSGLARGTAVFISELGEQARK